MSQLEGSPIVFLYGIVCTFGALANLVVLFAFIRTSNLRNLRNSFIVNLACSDLLLCVVTAPVTLYTSANVFWPFGNISCKVLASVQAVNTFVSSLTLALIAMDRVLLTTCPVKCYTIPHCQASSSNSTNRLLLYRVDSVDSDRSTVLTDRKIKKSRLFRAMGRCAHACDVGRLWPVSSGNLRRNAGQLGSSIHFQDYVHRYCVGYSGNRLLISVIDLFATT
ncbi:7 transmembrane receptor [Ancylostoma duodenale]|uniref:7 transmembrane receptor n=1 Tax=Ancylostoma duodenale TaxID=51022 RepID=A0A0C2GPZ5_9BILA|nr:7 transmembrane receptor [Ancylostoma duodenale]